MHKLSNRGAVFVCYWENASLSPKGEGLLASEVLDELQAYAVSYTGMELTESCEGCRLEAYTDSAGVWTIGYGHTGKDVHPGLTIAQDQADALLLHDMEAAVSFVNRHVQVPLTQNQFDALVDFTFNLGVGTLLTSTLLRKLNARDYAGAAAEFPHWNHAGGVVLEGLTKRRAAEQALFLKAA